MGSASSRLILRISLGLVVVLPYILFLVMKGQISFWQMSISQSEPQRLGEFSLKNSSANLREQVVPSTTETPTEMPKEEVIPVSNLSSKPSIVEFLHGQDWEKMESTFNNIDSRRVLLQNLVAGLTDFAIREPTVEISPECSVAPPLASADTVQCSSYPSGLSGTKRATPARIAHMIQFGFEVDTLEIHLREVYDVVDYFFILESSRSQFENLLKPLVWEHVRTQSRFTPFLDKIVHIVLDDISSMGNNGANPDIWYLEHLQESERFKRFLAWNQKAAQPFGEDDMVGFGDADEVPNRDTLNFLKYCYPKGDAVDIGIWFPMGKLTHAFRTHWPVSGHPFSLGDPTFHTVKGAKASLANGRPPSRNRGTSGPFLLGGMHMTRHRLLPFMILETITCTECGWRDVEFIKRIRNTMASGTFDEIYTLWDEIHTISHDGRLVELDELPAGERDALVKIPWFLQCNHARYPYWWGERDTRFDTTP